MRIRPYRRRRLDRTTRARYDALLAAHLDGAPDRPDDLTRYLDHLASLETFAFHGSNHRLDELRTTQAKDTRDFGNQHAVYATPDPHWAMYYALVNRQNAWNLRNASMAFGPRARTRWYWRDVRVADPAAPLTVDGYLHVLPRDGFRAEPRVAGLVDLVHWATDAAVTPLFVLPVAVAQYPLARLIRRVP
ncbi:hypothetical protein [Xylanimonas protaetiae]|uniref:Uncharacterized protein n=1 Tax=Xylanimonas protaetiae TaxID=2509457 RepID=A0A4P6F580_9MICO|nr:hypothetical protein [Xylanimonas protaetiae]QAY71110.1 hypothetical protein ET471_14585 [Xylanimonas protaetiae]